MKDALTQALITMLTTADCGIVCAHSAGTLPLIGGKAVDVRTELPGCIDHDLTDDGVILHFKGRKVRVTFEDAT